MTKLDRQIVATMTRLVGWLVQGNVAAIEEYTKGRRLSADLLQQAVSDYERKLVMPPHIADVLDAIEVGAAQPRAWSVRVDLWTEEEGRSDLTLECTRTDGGGDLLPAEIDNLHVS